MSGDEMFKDLRPRDSKDCLRAIKRKHIATATVTGILFSISSPLISSTFAAPPEKQAPANEKKNETTPTPVVTPEATPSASPEAVPSASPEPSATTTQTPRVPVENKPEVQPTTSPSPVAELKEEKPSPVVAESTPATTPNTEDKKEEKVEPTTSTTVEEKKTEPEKPAPVETPAPQTPAPAPLVIEAKAEEPKTQVKADPSTAPAAEEKKSEEAAPVETEKKPETPVDKDSEENPTNQEKSREVEVASVAVVTETESSGDTNSDTDNGNGNNKSDTDNTTTNSQGSNNQGKGNTLDSCDDDQGAGNNKKDDPAACLFTISYSANTGGTISGLSTQSVSFGESAALVTASPNKFYIFKGWSDGVSTLAHQVVKVTGDASFSAAFEFDQLAFNEEQKRLDLIKDAAKKAAEEAAAKEKQRLLDEAEKKRLAEEEEARRAAATVFNPPSVIERFIERIVERVIAPVVLVEKAPEPVVEKVQDPMEMLIEIKPIVWDFLVPATVQAAAQAAAPAPLLLTSSEIKATSAKALTTMKTVISNQVVTMKDNVAKAKTAVYFDMNSTKLDAQDRQVLRNLVNAVSAKLTSASKVTMEIVGWVQPTKVSPNVDGLSTGRAKAALDYLKSLGMKNASIKVVAPGEGKANVSKTRMATVDVTWTNPNWTNPEN